MCGQVECKKAHTASMTSEQQIEVYRQHRASQDKYAYFLLAAAGAAIGFALNQTQGAKLSWSQVPLGCAVLLWGLSFFFGCYRLTYIIANLSANATLLQVQAGEHPGAGTSPQLIATAIETIRENIESQSKGAITAPIRRSNPGRNLLYRVARL
jgi:hypothetical protein